MRKILIAVMFVLAFSGSAFADCIYHYEGDINGESEYGLNGVSYDQFVVHLDRASFPVLEVGRSYTVRYSFGEKIGGDTIVYCFDATYTCTWTGSDLDTSCGTVDYGTLVDPVSCAGFENIAADRPIGDDDFIDFSPEEEAEALLTYYFHFDTSDSVVRTHIIIEVYD